MKHLVAQTNLDLQATMLARRDLQHFLNAIPVPVAFGIVNTKPNPGCLCARVPNIRSDNCAIAKIPTI
jgi:hypothetical protein